MQNRVVAEKPIDLEAIRKRQLEHRETNFVRNYYHPAYVEPLAVALPLLSLRAYRSKDNYSSKELRKVRLRRKQLGQICREYLRKTIRELDEERSREVAAAKAVQQEANQIAHYVNATSGNIVKQDDQLVNAFFVGLKLNTEKLFGARHYRPREEKEIRARLQTYSNEIVRSIFNNTELKPLPICYREDEEQIQPQPVDHPEGEEAAPQATSFDRVSEESSNEEQARQREFQQLEDRAKGIADKYFNTLLPKQGPVNPKTISLFRRVLFRDIISLKERARAKEYCKKTVFGRQLKGLAALFQLNPEEKDQQKEAALLQFSDISKERPEDGPEDKAEGSPEDRQRFYDRICKRQAVNRSAGRRVEPSSSLAALRVNSREKRDFIKSQRAESECVLEVGFRRTARGAEPRSARLGKQRSKRARR